MTNIPNRCENCIFVQYNTYDDTYECYNPCCAVMDTRKEGRCEYHITEDDLRGYYKARILNELTNTGSFVYEAPCYHCKHKYTCHLRDPDLKDKPGYACFEERRDESMNESKPPNELPTSSWTRATPCKFMDEGYCKCEHLVESVRRSANNADYNPECLFVGIWNQARVVCMAYEKKPQRFEIRVHGMLEKATFDSRERAEKFIKERIEIIEVE